MRRRRPRGVLWMAAYVVCVTLVLSFIFFEVLDVDGSDFVNPLRAATGIKAAEAESDLRRASLQSANPAPLLAVVLHGHSEKLQVQRRVDAACADTPTHTSLWRASRSTLARGLLADPSRFA